MKTILIVDAEASSSGIEEILTRYGFSGIVAPTAYAALEIIRKNSSIDLIVTELQFPDMDGLQFLTAVRNTLPCLPVIIVTSCCSIESYLHAVRLGVYEYLSKPVLSKELVRIVNIALTSPQPSPPELDAA